MSIKQDLPSQFVSEYSEYQRLFLKGSTRTSVGNISFTSTSSGTTYTTTNNTGENGMLSLLQNALSNYMINASDWNSIGFPIGINVLDYDVTGNGVTDDYAALYAMLTTLGTVNQFDVFFPTGTYKISSNIVFPSNINLIFANGAMLSPDSGKTVTINGMITTGIQQIFTGAGTIIGTPKIKEIYPEWFGAVGNGSTDDSSPLQLACDFSALTHIPVILSAKTYIIKNITLKSYTTINGISNRKSVLQSIANNDTEKLGLITIYDADTERITLQNFTIIGARSTNTSGLHGILIDNIGSVGAEVFDHFHILRDLFLYAMDGDACRILASRGCELLRVVAYYCDGNGINMVGTDNQLTDCVVGAVGFSGFVITSNNYVSNCKAFYTGQIDTETNGDGFQIIGYQVMMSNCEAQECGRHGLYVSNISKGLVCSSFSSDSNNRYASGYKGVGIYLDGADNCMISGSVCNRYVLAGNMKYAIEYNGLCIDNNINISMWTDTPETKPIMATDPTKTFKLKNVTIVNGVNHVGLVGDGVTDNYTAFNTLLTSIGSTPTDLYFPTGTYKLSTSITIPSNVKLIFANGAMLSPDSTKTITINGAIEAGIQQIFTGNGTIIGAPKVSEVYPEWWGAKGDWAGNGTGTDDSVAFTKAFNYMLQNEGGVLLLTRKYLIVNTTFYLNNSDATHTIQIKGLGKASAIILKNYDRSWFIRANMNSNADDTNGTAQTDGSPDNTHIVLSTDASAVDDKYNGYTIEIVDGTGIGQTRTISDYVGSTRRALVSKAWDTTPDNTSVYSVALNEIHGELLQLNRIVFSNITISGDESTRAWVAQLGAVSHKCEDLALYKCQKGFYSVGYNDNCSHRKIDWSTPIDGGFYFRNASSGDSLVIEELFTQNSKAVYLEKCGGASINACNGGQYYFIDSNPILVQGGHFEFIEYAPTFTIKNSKVTLNTNGLRSGASTNPAILIDDDLTSIRFSKIHLINNTFARDITNPASSVADIIINEFKIGSDIWINNSNAIAYHSTGTGLAGNYLGLYGNYLGLNISSNIVGLQQQIDLHSSLFMKQCEIKYEEGSWRILPTNSRYADIFALPTPSATFADYDLYGDNAAHYYYKFELRTVGGLKGIASNEYDYNKTSNSTKSTQIQITGAIKNTLLVIYKGTTSGVYSRYAIVPITTDEPLLIDMSGFISSVKWQTTNIPTPSTVQSCAEGTYNMIDGNKIMRMTELPTASTYSFLAGDIIKIKTPTLGLPSEYVCVTSGTPGTWRVNKQTVKKDITANRVTPSASDIGLLYLDTTLDADGLPIWWNGTKWIKSDGSDA